MIVGLIVLSTVGMALLIIGCLIWKQERISLRHEYHYDKVSEEHKAAYCTLSGIGILLIGVGLLITAVLFGLTHSAYSFLAFAVGFVSGLALLLFAGARYNSNANHL